MTESSYKPLTVTLMEPVAGVQSSIYAMRLPMMSHAKADTVDGDIGPADAKLARKLILAGDVHGKFQRGVTAFIRLEMQAGFMIEWLTYREGRTTLGQDDLSTSSAMLTDLRGIKGEELAEKKQADLPGKIYTRVEKISYQTLRSIYNWRRNHRHPDWQIFCRFIEYLPYFDTLIWPESHDRTTATEACTAADPLKISIEVLAHFQCPHCSKWWSIGDAPDREFWFCPWCGTKSRP